MEAEEFLIKKYNSNVVYKIYKIISSCINEDQIDIVEKWIRDNDLNYIFYHSNEYEASILGLIDVAKNRFRFPYSKYKNY